MLESSDAQDLYKKSDWAALETVKGNTGGGGALLTDKPADVIDAL